MGGLDCVHIFSDSHQDPGSAALDELTRNSFVDLVQKSGLQVIKAGLAVSETELRRCCRGGGMGSCTAIESLKVKSCSKPNSQVCV